MILLQVIKKFSLILSRHQKLRIAELAILMTIGGFLEMCSVSLVLPFMEAAMSPETVMHKPYVSFICDLCGIRSSRDLLIVIAVLLALVYVLKNVYLLFEYHVQYRFVYGNMFEMQKRLLDHFIHRPYEYFLGINSGEIIRIVNTDTPATFSILLTILNLITESIVLCMLIAAVFFITPFVTFMLSEMQAVMLVMINILIKPVLKRAGIENQKAGAGMNKWLLQSIQGIKELKVMNKESFFQQNYDDYGKRYVRALRKKEILNITPRFVIEAVSMASMFIVLAVMLYRGQDLKSIIPTVSAVVMAAVRLLPSVNRISGSLASIAYGEPMLDKLIENLKDISGKEDDTALPDLEAGLAQAQSEKFCSKIIFHKISYHYPDSSKNILNDTCIEISRGESIGIAGSSGSGKTTTVDILLGLLQPQKGQVFMDGTDIRSNMRAWHDQIGYIPQTIFMLDDSIRMNVSFGSEDEMLSDQEIWRALKQASLEEFVKGLPHGLDTQIGEQGIRLSGGQRQRLGIARALYKNPDILIFDEATSALDHETESAIMESIHHLHGQKTMIIIAHRLSTIEACDRIYQVENGKISVKSRKAVVD